MIYDPVRQPPSTVTFGAALVAARMMLSRLRSSAKRTGRFGELKTRVTTIPVPRNRDSQTDRQTEHSGTDCLSRCLRLLTVKFSFSVVSNLLPLPRRFEVDARGEGKRDKPWP